MGSYNTGRVLHICISSQICACDVECWDRLDYYYSATTRDLGATSSFEAKAYFIGAVLGGNFVRMFTDHLDCLLTMPSSMSCGCVQIYYGVVLTNDKFDKSMRVVVSMWALPEAAAGLLVACFPVFPKFLRFAGQTPTVSKLSTKVRGLLGKSSKGSLGSSSTDPPTIGQIRVKPVGHLDMEFQTLIHTKNSTRVNEDA